MKRGRRLISGSSILSAEQDWRFRTYWRNWGSYHQYLFYQGAQANKKNVSHYITFKHAMNGFTKAAAFEYGDLGITVNAISPGAIETDLMMEAGYARQRPWV